MLVSKFDLCDSCRAIRPITDSDKTIEEIIDSVHPNSLKNPMAVHVINDSILLYLKKTGGCHNCINLVKQAMQS